MKLAVVVVPSVSTLFDSVGLVLTAAVLYTSPLAESAEPVIPCPPEEAVVAVIDEAAVVVVILGTASRGTNSPVLRRAPPEEYPLKVI